MIPELPTIMLACARIGAPHSVVFGGFSASALRDRINDAQARVLVTADGGYRRGQVSPLKPNADEALADTPSVEHVLVVRRGGNDVEMVEGRDRWWHEVVDRQEADCACEPMDAEDLLYLLYTSGTTGKPKGAVTTHGSILSSRDATASGEEMRKWQEPIPGDVTLLAMPCFHISGTGTGIGTMVAGSNSIVLPEYDPTKALDLIENFNISKIFLVPAAIQILLNHPRVSEVDFSRLKYVTYGASPIPLELMREAMRVMGCGFVQMYGMTETSGTIVALDPEDHVPKGSPRMRSVGKPLAGVEIKIIDEAGNIVPPGTVGEIATRSSKNMRGYWNNPEATAATIDAEGWLRTGDAGYLDEDGYLYIHDRVKDMIISGGENVYPAEVENALYSHPKVADVAVIGVPDEKWGEAVKACVVVKAGEELSEAELIAHARQHIAGYKCPKSVNFIEALPRNPSGKILRRELRAPYWEGKDRAVN
jgi:acyl-coenzyme A synthetase/AMP-(fatty) acid ligase